MALDRKQKQAVAVSLAIQERRDQEAARMAQHPGFDRVSRKIASRTNPRTGKPYGMKRARAIVAYKARNASAEAKRENPRLKRVSGA